MVVKGVGQDTVLVILGKLQSFFLRVILVIVLSQKVEKLHNE